MNLNSNRRLLKSSKELDTISAQEGGGKYSELYKSETVVKGSNDIVCMCHKNISGASCHFGYMGISFNGVIKNLSLSREPLAYFIKQTPELIQYSVPTVGGAKSKTRRSKSKRKQRKTRK
jgi:hypothetical protein